MRCTAAYACDWVAGDPRSMYRLTAAGQGLMVSDNLATYNAATLAKHPTLVHLCCPTLDRIAAEQARALLAQDYFAKWNTATGNPGAAGS